MKHDIFLRTFPTKLETVNHIGVRRCLYAKAVGATSSEAFQCLCFTQVHAYLNDRVSLPVLFLSLCLARRSEIISERLIATTMDY